MMLLYGDHLLGFAIRQNSSARVCCKGFTSAGARFCSAACRLQIPTKSPADSEMMSPGDTR
jgi:hypothetical protein